MLDVHVFCLFSQVDERERCESRWTTGDKGAIRLVPVQEPRLCEASGHA